MSLRKLRILLLQNKEEPFVQDLLSVYDDDLTIKRTPHATASAFRLHGVWEVRTTLHIPAEGLAQVLHSLSEVLETNVFQFLIDAAGYRFFVYVSVDYSQFLGVFRIPLSAFQSEASPSASADG